MNDNLIKMGAILNNIASDFACNLFWTNSNVRIYDLIVMYTMFMKLKSYRLNLQHDKSYERALNNLKIN